MNLARDALRLAMLETLQPGGPDGGPFPTLAGAFVYDSEFGAVSEHALDSRTPLIAVWTDEDEQSSENQDALDDHGPTRTVTLVIEIVVPQLLEGGAYTPALSDFETEAHVGLVGQQIEIAVRRSRQAGPLRHVLVRVAGVKSEAIRDADTLERLAHRRIEIECVVRNGDTLAGTGEGIDRLPEPLRSVARTFPDGSPRAELMIMFAKVLAAPDPAAMLTQIRQSANLPGSNAPLLTAASVASPSDPDVGGRVTYP